MPAESPREVIALAAAYGLDPSLGTFGHRDLKESPPKSGDAVAFFSNDCGSLFPLWPVSRTVISSISDCPIDREFIEYADAGLAFALDCDEVRELGIEAILSHLGWRKLRLVEQVGGRGKKAFLFAKAEFPNEEVLEIAQRRLFESAINRALRLGLFSKDLGQLLATETSNLSLIDADAPKIETLRKQAYDVLDRWNHSENYRNEGVPWWMDGRNLVYSPPNLTTVNLPSDRTLAATLLAEANHELIDPQLHPSEAIEDPTKPILDQSVTPLEFFPSNVGNGHEKVRVNRDAKSFIEGLRKLHEWLVEHGAEFDLTPVASSSARSPVYQYEKILHADTASPTKAPPLDTPHSAGLAVDIQATEHADKNVPPKTWIRRLETHTGTADDVRKYNRWREVVKSFGLDAPVSDDPIHVSLPLSSEEHRRIMTSMQSKYINALQDYCTKIGSSISEDAKKLPRVATELSDKWSRTKQFADKLHEAAQVCQQKMEDLARAIGKLNEYQKQRQTDPFIPMSNAPPPQIQGTVFPGGKSIR